MAHICFKRLWIICVCKTSQYPLRLSEHPEVQKNKIALPFPQTDNFYKCFSKEFIQTRETKAFADFVTSFGK